MKKGHIPIRTCKGCGRKRPLQVRTDWQFSVVLLFAKIPVKDRPRRGIYCCRNAECRIQLRKKNKQLKYGQFIFLRDGKQ